MTAQKVMTLEHPRWIEFVARLDEALIVSKEPFEWRCNHDHAYSRAIMADIGDADIEASIAYFEHHGGHCDCEVMLNVVIGDQDHDPEYFHNVKIIHAATLMVMTCHRTFIQRRLESRGFLRQVARVEQRTIGGAGRGCVAGRPLR
jgi:Protein of unknown function (DUF2695)